MRTLFLCAAALAAAMQGAPARSEVVGWRGDGTGVFPKATPPLEWSISGGQSRNIVWKSEMPGYSPSSVVVAGECLFTTGNDYTLVCVAKRTGKILWVRPVSPYDAATPEDRAAHPAEFAKLDELAKRRDEIAARIPAAGDGEVMRLATDRQKIESEMEKLLRDTDAERYKGTGMTYSDGGYMSTTPTTDGEHVWAWNGWGVTACYDLAGNRKWIRFDKLLEQEHGHHGSPLLVGDKVIIYVGKQYLALDAKTGRELWRSENHVPNNFAGYWYGSHVPGVVGGEPVFAAGDGSLIRVRDGGRFLKGQVHQGAPSPVIGGGWVVWVDGVGDVMYCPLPSTTQGSAKAPFKSAGFDRAVSDYKQSSPLYHDGLIYVMGTKPVLFVHDPAASKTVYQKDLTFEPPQARGDRPYGCGINSSPSFAGGRIYIWGNFGTTLVIEPGREYKELARNVVDVRFDYNWKQNLLEGTVSNPLFEGSHIYYRAQRYMYCIGEPGKPFASAEAPREKPKPPAAAPKPEPKAAEPREVAPMTDGQKARGLLSVAENYIRSGMKDPARKKLEELLEKYPDSEQAAEARKKLAELSK